MKMITINELARCFHTSALMVICAMLVACQNNEICESQGSPCARECAEGETAICVTSSICSCVADIGGDESGTEAGTEAGDDNGGNSGGGMGPSQCEPPTLGDLVINEVMIDAEGDENSYEYVEVANLSDHAIDLSGIKLSYKGSEKISFLSGCMASKSLVALFASEDEWIWSSPVGNLNMMKSAFRFSNSSDFSFELIGADGQELNNFVGENALVSEGVSINRSPDFSGESLVQHQDISALPNSPALCSNGAKFEDDCIGSEIAGMMAGGMAGEEAGTESGSEAGAVAGEEAGAVAGMMAGNEPEPPCELAMPGELIINEVMIDPSGDESRDEYIELVNLSDQAVYLGGLTFKYKERNQIIFNHGCMPAQSIAALYDDESLWVWSSPVDNLSYEKLSFQFTNSSDFEFSLSREGQVIDQLSGTVELIESGVSVNRNPDFSPEEFSVDLHTSLNSELQSSPGFCANGGDFTENCFVEVSGGEAMAGEVMAGEAMAGEVMAGETMAGEAMAGEAMAGEAMAGEAMAGEAMAGEAMAGEAMAGEAMAGEAMAGEAMAGEAMAGEAMAGEAMAGEAMAGEAMAGEAMAGEAMAGEAMAGEAMAGEAMAGEAMAGEAMAGEAMAGEAMAGEAMAGEAMAGEAMAGEAMAGEAMAGEAMAGEAMAGEAMAGEAMAGEAMAGEAMAGEAMAGEAMAGDVPPNCMSPVVGQLVINEVLANPDGNESSDRSEWLEIVNTSDEFIEMNGLSLWEAGQEEIVFAQGCMAPQSALVIYNQAGLAAWQWSSPPTGLLASESTGSFGMTNSTDLLLELKHGDETLNSFSAPQALIQSGVSINRSPDASADGALVLHNTLNDLMTSFSIGLCANGARFERACISE